MSRCLLLPSAQLKAITNHLRSILTSLEEERVMESAKCSYEQHRGLGTGAPCRRCGLIGGSIEHMQSAFSGISWPATTTTSAKPSQPTTQVPHVTPATPNTSPGYLGSINYYLPKSHGLLPLHSDPTDPLPPVPFDPTIGEIGETVWGELVEVIGKQVIDGRTEYGFKRQGSPHMSWTVVLKRPSGSVPTPKGCQHTWAEYMGFTETYKYCTICDEKWRG